MTVSASPSIIDVREAAARVERELRGVGETASFCRAGRRTGRWSTAARPNAQRRKNLGTVCRLWNCMGVVIGVRLILRVRLPESFGLETVAGSPEPLSIFLQVKRSVGDPQGVSRAGPNLIHRLGRVGAPLSRRVGIVLVGSSGLEISSLERSTDGHSDAGQEEVSEVPSGCRWGINDS